MSGDFGQILPLEEDSTCLRPVKTTDAVEHGCFARPIGSDYGQDLSPVYLETDIRQCCCPAKTQRYILDAKQNRV